MCCVACFSWQEKWRDHEWAQKLMTSTTIFRKTKLCSMHKNYGHSWRLEEWRSVGRLRKTENHIHKYLCTQVEAFLYVLKSIMLGVITCIFWVLSSKVDNHQVRHGNLSNDVRFGKIQLQFPLSICFQSFLASPSSECVIFIISFYIEIE